MNPPTSGSPDVARRQNDTRVTILSLSPIADDPRVRRQGDALHAAGFKVRAVGYAGARSAAPLWPITELAAPGRSPAHDLVVGARTAAAGWTGQALRGYWLSRFHRAMLRATEQAPADLFIANDWRTLPIAAEAARKRSAKYGYDSHEYGVAEGASRRFWRLTFPRYIFSIEKTLIPGALFFTTVSPGIAWLLQRDYGGSTPVVIRNMPPFQRVEPRSTGIPITVLYHGNIKVERALDRLVQSVEHWRPEFRLVIRGMGPPSVVEHLRTMAERSPASDRIRIEPAVPMTELVRFASEADIGIHPLPPLSDEELYALPNKLFEYMMAGLAVCVSDLPDMADVVRSHQAGITIAELSPLGIARAVNSLDQASIDRYRGNALAAAQELELGPGVDSVHRRRARSARRRRELKLLQLRQGRSRRCPRQSSTPKAAAQTARDSTRHCTSASFSGAGRAR